MTPNATTNNQLLDTPFSTMHWFVGKVESIDDPMKINRVRVRCIGYHDTDLSKVPVEALPWAPVIHSTAYMSAPMLVVGDMVVGFFLDGDTLFQQPLVLGAITGTRGGVPTNAETARGEIDPNVRRAERGAIKDVEVSNGTSWSEPPSPAAPIYPANKVMKTAGGSMIELDDTDGVERVRVFHVNGSFIEMHPDGRVVHRANGARYDVTLADHFIYVNGSCNISAASQINLTSGGDLNLSAVGNVNMVAGGEMRLEAGGAASLLAGGVASVDGSRVNLGSGPSRSLRAPVVARASPVGDADLAQRPAARIAGDPVVDRAPEPTPTDIPTEQPRTTGVSPMSSNEMIRAMNRAGLRDGVLRAQIMAQTAHESGNFRFREENLNYSAEALIRVWPNRYNQSNVARYARNPQAIAEKSYGGRMGNGPEGSGDGFKYRGRGFIQLTGKSNYIQASRALGVDFVNNPDAAAQDPYAADLAVWYCTRFRPLTNPSDVRASTQIINGGQNGYEDRLRKFEQYKNDPAVTNYDPNNV